jgi:hypothetical protein
MDKNKQILESAMASKVLQPTEINLLRSNKIDRKTILLNHMLMFDKAASGNLDLELMAQKHEKLMEKLSSQRLSMSFDVEQQSLD